MIVWLLQLLLVLAVSYFLGSIPFAAIAAYLIRGIDIKQHGTRNLGASNVLWVVGFLPALMVFVADVLKGLASAGLASWVFGPVAFAEISLAGFAAILGHDFPLFYRFRGGKVVATTYGVLLVMDWKLALFLIPFWLLSAAATQYFIPSTLITFWAVPFIMWLTSASPAYILFGLVNAGLAMYRHGEDIRRLLAGEEKTIFESLRRLKGRFTGG